MSTNDRTDRTGPLFGKSAEVLAGVLMVGDLDDHSREQLQALCRLLSEASATYVRQPSSKWEIIEMLELGARTYNALKRADIHRIDTLEELVREDRLRDVPGMGPVALADVAAALKHMRSEVLR